MANLQFNVKRNKDYVGTCKTTLRTIIKAFNLDVIFFLSLFSLFSFTCIIYPVYPHNLARVCQKRNEIK